MINIPDSVTIQRLKAREGELYQVGREWLEKDERSPGIHASGLLDPRLAYFNAKFPGPLPDRLVTMFMVGRVLHAFVLGSHAGSVDIGSADAGSRRCDLGFDYSPDAFLDGKVREVKTSRSFYEPKSLEDVSMYVEQLLVYMVATETTESELWVLFLNLKDESGKTSPAFRCYTVRISAEDLAALRVSLAATTTALQAALDAPVKSEAFRSLDLCRAWKCGARNCEYYDQCQPEGRYGTEAFDKTGATSARTKSKRKSG
jgi:hypothetical protein